MKHTIPFLTWGHSSPVHGPSGRRALVALLVMIACIPAPGLPAAIGPQTGSGPMSFAELLRLIQDDQPRKAILDRVLLRKVDFDLSDAQIAQLTNAWKVNNGEGQPFPGDLVKAIRDSYIPAKAVLTIACNVGCSLSTGGKTIGRAGPEGSFRGEFSPGEISVAAAAPGYADQTRSVSIAAGTSPRLDFVLSELPGSIEVSTTPPDAEWLLNGRPQGTIRAVSNLRPGTYSVQARRRGYRDSGIQTVTVKAGASTPVGFGLQKIVRPLPEYDKLAADLVSWYSAGEAFDYTASGELRIKTRDGPEHRATFYESVFGDTSTWAIAFHRLEVSPLKYTITCTRGIITKWEPAPAGSDDQRTLGILSEYIARLPSMNVYSALKHLRDPGSRPVLAWADEAEMSPYEGSSNPEDEWWGKNRRIILTVETGDQVVELLVGKDEANGEIVDEQPVVKQLTYTNKKSYRERFVLSLDRNRGPANGPQFLLPWQVVVKPETAEHQLTLTYTSIERTVSKPEKK